jgi:hypothetical protein
MSGVGYSTKQFRMFDEFSSFVSQKAEGFLLYPTPDSFSSVVSQPQKNLLRYITLRRRFCFLVGYSGKNYTMQNNILNSKCLSLTSDENLAKSDT